MKLKKIETKSLKIGTKSTKINMQIKMMYTKLITNDSCL